MTIKTALTAFFVTAFSAGIAAADTLTYSLSGNFERWWGLRTTERGPYTGSFGGSFTYDTALRDVTAWNMSMDFRYTGGTIETITLTDGPTRASSSISGNVLTMKESYRWSSSPLQNRMRIYLGDLSDWGDTTLTVDLVWGDVDTFTGGRGFVGTSPHNNDTGTAAAGLVASSGPDTPTVPLPASLPLMAAGLGGLAVLRRRARG